MDETLLLIGRSTGGNTPADFLFWYRLKKVLAKLWAGYGLSGLAFSLSEKINATTLHRW